MTKKSWAAALNRELRYALRSYHADSGISQEELASRMRITPGACSALENGEHGFSVFFNDRAAFNAARHKAVHADRKVMHHDDANTRRTGITKE